jgi:hypothetical protein
MFTTVLRWIVAFILGIAAIVVVTLASALFAIIGTVLGVISTGTVILIVVAAVINEWWQYRK